MKCEVALNQSYINNKLNKNYYVSIEANNGRIIRTNGQISKLLDLKLEEYEAYGKLNGAEIILWICYFETEKECQKFMEEFVEPRLVMHELIR